MRLVGGDSVEPHLPTKETRAEASISALRGDAHCVRLAALEMGFDRVSPHHGDRPLYAGWFCRSATKPTSWADAFSLPQNYFHFS